MKEKLSRNSKFKYYLSLLWEMVLKSYKVQYKKMYLGFGWFFLYPVMQMLVASVVISVFLKVSMTDYFLSLYIGLVFWNAFNYTVQTSTLCYIKNRNLIKKTVFPKSVIPLSICVANIIQISLPITILLGISIVNKYFIFSNLFILFIVYFLFLILIFAISLIVSILNVRFRDLYFIVQGGLQILFYISPVLYQTNLVPNNWMVLFYLNPLTSIIELTRSVIIGSAMPANNLMLVNLFVILLLLNIGYFLFRKNKDLLDDWL
ncbi:MAG: ABC transporter permease [Patescibacteria group bacterium]